MPIDILKELQSALDAKGTVRKKRTDTITKRVCTYRVQDAGDGPGRIGGPGRREPICHQEVVSTDTPYDEPLRALDYYSVRDLNADFGANTPTSLPQTAHVQSVRIKNCTSVAENQTIAIHFTVTLRKTISVTKTTTDGMSLQASFKYSADGIEAGATIGLTETRSLQEGTTSGKDEIVEVDYSIPMNNAPRTLLLGEYRRFEIPYVIPFTITMVVDGHVDANEDGYKKLSDALPESNRTFIIEGFVTAGVLSANSSTTYLSKDLNEADCPAPEDHQSIALLTKGRTARVGEFPPPRHERKEVRIEQNTIGPPDGTSYEIISTREETRMSSACGYNDAGVPNPALYLIEDRKYSEYRDGKLVRSWIETTDTFVECVV